MITFLIFMKNIFNVNKMKIICYICIFYDAITKYFAKLEKIDWESFCISYKKYWGSINVFWLLEIPTIGTYHFYHGESLVLIFNQAFAIQKQKVLSVSKENQNYCRSTLRSFCSERKKHVPTNFLDLWYIFHFSKFRNFLWVFVSGGCFFDNFKTSETFWNSLQKFDRQVCTKCSKILFQPTR